MPTYHLTVCNETISVNTRTGKGLDNLFNKLPIRSMAVSYFIDGEETSDKMQNIKVKILQIIPKYDSNKSSFITWVNRCVKNEIRDNIKKNKIRHNVTGYSTNYNLLEADKNYCYEEDN